MLTKLFMVCQVDGKDFGLVLPRHVQVAAVEYVPAAFVINNPAFPFPKAKVVAVDEGQLYPQDKLSPASPSETVAVYNSLLQDKLVPLHCYWFYIQEEGNDGTIPVKPGHLPVYHFGIKQFFSGRVGFDWNRGGGTVYRIQYD